MLFVLLDIRTRMLPRIRQWWKRESPSWESSSQPMAGDEPALAFSVRLRTTRQISKRPGPPLVSPAVGLAAAFLPDLLLLALADFGRALSTAFAFVKWSSSVG